MAAVFGNVSEAKAVCYGSGRFLRCVLIPALSRLGISCAIAQARSAYVVDMLKVPTLLLWPLASTPQSTWFTHMHPNAAQSSLRSLLCIQTVFLRIQTNDDIVDYTCSPSTSFVMAYPTLFSHTMSRGFSYYVSHPPFPFSVSDILSLPLAAS